MLKKKEENWSVDTWACRDDERPCLPARAAKGSQLLQALWKRAERMSLEDGNNRETGQTAAESER